MKDKKYVRSLCLLCMALIFVMSTGMSAFALTVTDSAIVDEDVQFSYSYTTTLTKNNDGWFHSDKTDSSVGTSGFTKITNTDETVTIKVTAVSTYCYKKGATLDAKDATTTLTLTNSTSDLLAVSYVDSDIPEYSGSGTFYIPASGSVTMSVTADTWADNTASICAVGSMTITAIDVAVLETVNFYGTQYGSYTWTVGDANGSVAVGSEPISSAVAGTTTAYANTTLTATVTDVANDGYKFVGWLSDGKLLGTGTTLSTTTDGAMNIYPAFVPEDTVAAFTVNGTAHYFWSTAMNASASSGYPAILTGDYTLPGTLLENGLRTEIAGLITGSDNALTYTVPNGAKLLVPRSSDDTGTFSTSISGAETTDKDRSAYVTLTVPGGSKLSVLGAMNVNAVQREADTGATSSVNGEYGHVYLGEDSVLSIGNGGMLFCYGFITGDGYVEALSGAKVYEILQVGDWKGGTATLDWKNDSESHTNPVFAINQYFIQNIEADYVICAGATEGVTTYLQTFGLTSTTLIGSDGFFNLTSGSVLRSYDANADQVTYTLQDKAVLNMQSMTIPYSYSIFSGELSSENYIFAIPNNMSFRLGTGTTMNVTSDLRMLPGSEFIVDEGANLNVNAALYIYGTTEWMSGKYCDTAYYARSAYSATLGGTPTRVVGNSTPSAKLEINGTMTVTGGIFSSGAVGGTTDPDKVINGTGKIINTGTVESRVISEYTRTKDSDGNVIAEPHEIQFQPAVARLAGLTTSGADYDNLSASTAAYPYIGLGDYWYTTTMTVTGAVDQIADDPANVVKNNGDGTYTLYAATQARLVLNSGYAAYQNDTVLGSTVSNGSASYVTADLTVDIKIAEAETVDVTVVMVGDEGVTRSFTIAVAPGTAVSGYYTDTACTTEATTVSGGETLYAKAVAWIEWDNGDADTYYTDFMEAMRAATNGDGELHLLASVQNTMSHHVAAGQTLKLYLNGRTITYTANLLDIYGDVTLDMEGGKIINYYKPIDELTATTTTTTDDDGNEVTTTTYDTAATAACALRSRSGGTLNLIVNGGSLGWAVPESYITDYGYVFSSTSYTTSLYNYAGGTMNVDLSSGEIYVDHPGVLSYTNGTYMLDVISNRGTMTVTGKGDGNGVIWSSAYCDATSYSNDNGTTCRVTTAIHNYGTSGSLTLNGVTVNSTNENASYIASIYSYHGATLTLQNTTINTVKGYAVMNRGGTITEVTDCTINCYSGIYSNKNNSYSASVGTIGGSTTINSSGDYGIYNRGSVDTIGGNTTINATGTYGIYNRGSIDTIGGENANVSITGLYYGVYLYADGEIDLIGGKNATVAISQTAAGASKKYYAPIRIAAGGHIGTIGVYATDTDNTQTTITLTAKAYYGIYAAGDGESDSIGTVGGPKANVTISAPLYAIYLTTNGSIGTIGAGNDVITLKSTSNKYYNLYLVSTASVDTIGGSGSVVNFTAAGTGSKNRHNLYVAGTIGTIGGAGSTVNFTGARGYDAAGYGIYVTDGGTVGTIGAANSTITLSGTSRNTTNYYRGIYVAGGSVVTQIGSTGATIKITDSAPAKGGFGIWAANGIIDSIGNGANITIKAYHGIAAGSSTAGYAGTVQNIGSESGSINITASAYGIRTMRNYLATGTIDSVGGNVEIKSSKYGVYCAGVIGGLADDLVVVTTGSTDYYAVYLAEASTTTVTETSTDADGNEVSTDVVYDVPAGTITLLSGGKYYHASGRDYIVSSGDVTYPGEDYGVSSDTVSVTLSDGTKKDCYYITQLHNHAYPEQATFKWVENEAGGYTVTATLTCTAEDCPDAPLTGTAEVTSVTTDATCTAEGKTIYTAKVTLNSTEYTDTKEVTLEKLGHTEVVDAAVDATCTTTGLTEGKHCSVCGTVTVAQTVVAANGHTEVIDAAKAATCTENGLTEGKHCSVCGTVTVAQTVVAANGHTEVIDAAVAATCTDTGLTEGKHCSVCNEVIVAQTVVAATGHTAGSGASCTVAQTCTVCGAEIAAATGHTEVTDAAVAATCTATGLTEGKHCSVCGTVTVAQTVVAANGHTEVTDAAVAPTCTTTGLTEGKHCSVCDTVTVAQTVVAATGHTEVTDAAVAPTCTTTGLTEGKHCSVCNEVIVAQTVVDALGHSYKSVVTAPTFGAQGYTTHTCSVCSDSYVDSYVDALTAVAKIGETKYETLAAAVAAAEAGETVTLLSDSTGAGVVINKSITIDFGGYTYTVNSAVGSTGTETLGFQILQGNDVTLKNGTLTSTAVAEGKEVKVLIQNYADLTLTDMNLKDSTEHILYCLSNNSGEIALTGNTSIITNAVAFDVYDYSSAGYAVPSMTVNTTGTIDGKIEVSETATLAISGGTFTVEIEEEWCAEGYGPSDNGDGTYGVHQHSYDAVVTAPTCTKDGYTTYTCKNCSHSYTGDKVEAAGHKWEDASCNTPKVCSVCSTTEGEKLSHTDEKPKDHQCDYCQVTLSGCSDSDTDSDHNCDTCDEVLSECSGGSATCTERAVCATCGQEYGDLADHSYTQEVATEDYLNSDATCTKKATYFKSCSCGEKGTETFEYGDAKDHSWDDGVVTKEPTSTETGEMTYTCGICGETKTEEIPATGDTECEHEYENLKCTKCGDVIANLVAIEVSYDAELLLWLKFKVPEDLLNDETAYVEVRQEISETYVKNSVISMQELKSQGVDAKGRYIIEQGVASAEMGYPVTVKFIDGTGENITILDYNDGQYKDSVSRTVVDYAKLALEKGSEKQKKMVTALLVYGGYAQKYFNRDADNPVYDVLEEYDISMPDISGINSELITQTLSKEGSSIGLNQTTQQAFLDSSIYHEVYFTMDEGRSIDEYSFALTYAKRTNAQMVEDTMEIQPEYDATKNRYVLTIPDIASPFLDYMYSIKIVEKSTNESYEVQTGVMVWVKLALEKSTNANQINLVKAIYYYNQVANEFFGM